MTDTLEMVKAPEIYEALANVMHDLRAVAKRDRNEQQRFIFRGIDAVVNAVGPILRKHRVLVVPDVERVEYAPVKTSTGKEQTSCRVLVRYVFHASDGSCLSALVAAEASDSGDKATPKAMAVAFRTALLQALALPTDDPDPDAPKPPKGTRAPQDTKPEGETRPMSRATTTTPAQRKMFALLGQTGRNSKESMLAYLCGKTGRDITSRTDITDDELKRVIDALEAEVAGMNEPSEDPEP